MLNKKRLAMMALAASMVVPTNLYSLPSMVTPILAQENLTDLTGYSLAAADEDATGVEVPFAEGDDAIDETNFPLDLVVLTKEGVEPIELNTDDFTITVAGKAGATLDAVDAEGTLTIALSTEGQKKYEKLADPCSIDFTLVGLQLVDLTGYSLAAADEDATGVEVPFAEGDDAIDETNFPLDLVVLTKEGAEPIELNTDDFTITVAGKAGATLDAVDAEGTLTIALSTEGQKKYEKLADPCSIDFTLVGLQLVDLTGYSLAAADEDATGVEVPFAEGDDAIDETNFPLDLVVLTKEGAEPIELNTDDFTITVAGKAGATLDAVDAEGTLTIALSTEGQKKYEKLADPCSIDFTLVGLQLVDLTGYSLAAADEDATGVEVPFAEGDDAIDETNFPLDLVVLTKDGAEPIELNTDDFTITVAGKAGATLDAVDAEGTLTIALSAEGQKKYEKLADPCSIDFTLVGDEEPGDEEVTSWIIKFEGTGAPEKSLTFTKDDVGTAETVAVDKYLTEIPTGFIYASKPEAIDFSQVEASGDNKDTKIKTIEIIVTPQEVEWTADNDATVTITTKDADNNTGTLELGKDALTADGKISNTAINEKLVGYKTEDANDVTLAAGDVIGYQDTDGSYKGLSFTSSTPVSIVKDVLNPTDKVTVTIGEGDSAITFEVEADKVADTGAGSTGELNNKKLATYLTERDENRNNVVVDGVTNNAPAYTYITTDLTSADKDIDPSGEAVVAEDSIKIQIEVTSSIRLLIPKNKEVQNAARITRSNFGENLETEEASDTVALIVQIADIDKLPVNEDGSLGDKKISAEEIANYITAQGTNLKDEKGNPVAATDLAVPSESEMDPIDLSDPLPLSGIVDNYYQVEAKAKDNSGTDDPGTGDDNTDPKAPASSSSNKKPKPKPEEPATPVVGTPTAMYRLYNKLNGEHLFTTDKNERDSLLTSDTWKDEGQGWTAPSVSDTPVYRLLNPNTGDHHYTTDKNEFDTLPSYGWVAEGIAFFSADKDNAENVILHRLYNPNAKGAGSHHYTADTNERDTLVAQGWKYEGTAWAGLPAGK